MQKEKLAILDVLSIHKCICSNLRNRSYKSVDNFVKGAARKNKDKDRQKPFHPTDVSEMDIFQLANTSLYEVINKEYSNYQWWKLYTDICKQFHGNVR